MPITGKSALKKNATSTKTQKTKLNTHKPHSNDEPADYGHFNKVTEPKNDDDWIQNEIKVGQQYREQKETEPNEGTVENDIMERKTYYREKKKSREDSKKQKWESVENESSDNVLSESTNEREQKIYFNDELELLENEGCKDLSQSLRKSNINIKQNPTDLQSIKASIKNFAMHDPLCSQCAERIENERSIKNEVEEKEEKSNTAEKSSTSGFNQVFDESSDSENEVETRLMSSSKRWTFTKDQSDSD